MTKTVIVRRIQRIKAELTKLSATLCAIENMDSALYPENYATLVTDAALRSETIACSVRHLLYDSTTIQKAEYLVAASSAHGITVRQNEDVLEVRLPCLLPKKKQRASPEFLIDPLYFSLSQYAETHMLPHFRHCVVCFCHIYSQELPASQIRDYDNLEMKQLLDVLAAFLMVDDTGLLVDAYNTTELGEQDSTCICIMDKSRFPQWLEERQNRLGSISDF